MTDNDKQQFEVWQKKWDDAASSFAKDFTDQLVQNQQRSEEQPSTSWLTNTPLERDYAPKEVEANPDWNDIYYRSQNIDGLLTESEIKYSKGAEKPKSAWGAFTPTKTNPTQQSTIGPDGHAPDGGVPVTPNWSDGEDLRELDDIKRRIESMERKHHEAEVKADKASPNLKKQLESLRDRVRKLSEKINREPFTDVT